MRKLLVRLGLFLAPLMLLEGLIIGLTIHSGQAMPYEQVVALQAADPWLYYRQYDMDVPHTFTYKLAALRSRMKPQVVIVGSSRVLAFQSQLLDQPERFYNFGIAGSHVVGVAAMVNSLTPETTPDILIIGIDLFWFNASSPTAVIATAPQVIHPTFDETIERTRQFIRSMVQGEIDLNTALLWHDSLGIGRALGLTAQMEGTGYLYDGSWVSNPWLIRQNRPIDAAVNYVNFFTTQGGTEVLWDNITVLENLIVDAKAHGIEIIGFFPPYSSEMYEFIQTGEQHGYFAPAKQAVIELFARYELPSYDFSDIRRLSASDSEMKDFVHPSPLLSARIFAFLARNHPNLAAYANPDRIERAIAEAESPYDVFWGY